MTEVYLGNYPLAIVTPTTDLLRVAIHKRRIRYDKNSLNLPKKGDYDLKSSDIIDLLERMIKKPASIIPALKVISLTFTSRYHVTWGMKSQQS